MFLLKFGGEYVYNILLVDDDRVVRYSLKKSKLWDEFGFAVSGEAVDGHEALTKVSSYRFDMAFVDIKMPRIDGIEFLKELRRSGESMCVVFMSRYSDFAYARQGIVLGAFDYILKPVDESNLSDVLSRARLHLDKKKREEKSHCELSGLMNESLKIYGFNDKINTLLQLIINSPDDAASFAEREVKSLVHAFENDTPKIKIILEHAQKSLHSIILEKNPWLASLDLFEIECKEEILCGCPHISSSFIPFVSYMASLVKKLHLNDKNSVVKQVCQYVLSHSDEKVSLKSTSVEIGFSSSYLSRIFRQNTGEGFVEYVTKIKMERAKALLKSGKYKNYEISDILGYKKADYFCCLFKKYTGVTPIDYR